jgi:hypothetical protein
MTFEEECGRHTLLRIQEVIHISGQNISSSCAFATDSAGGGRVDARASFRVWLAQDAALRFSVRY